MESVTLTIAAAVSVLIFLLSPIYGLIAYMAALIWYPQTLGVKLGPAAFSVSRIIIVALFAKAILTPYLTKQFKLIWLDRLVLIYFAARILSGIITTPDIMQLIEYNSGVFFDRALPYFAVRLIITKKEQYLVFLKWLLCLSAPLAIAAFYESVTGHNLLDWGRNIVDLPGQRWGLYRAKATFNNPVYLGVFFAMVGSLSLGLVKCLKKNVFLYGILIASVFLGVFSSMSSGAFLTAVSGVSFIAFFRFRHHWKTAIIGVMLMCGVVEVISNRHFYSVIDRFTFNTTTTWYRARLFEVAFFEGGMSGHWLCGYGFTDPRWCDKIDMRDHTDMVNQYLLVLCCHGLVGLIPFIAAIIAAIKRLFKNFRKIGCEADEWLVWCLAGGLLGVLTAFNSVSLFDQSIIVFSIMIGLCGSIPLIVGKRDLLVS